MCIRDRILIDLCPEFASKNSEIVDLIAVSRELSIACYDEQDWDKAYEITEQWLPKYPHHTDLLSAKIWISLQRGSQSLKAVSYTHLDVYKRQLFTRGFFKQK